MTPRLLIIATALLALAACTTREVNTGPGPDELFAQGKRQMDNGDYIGAVTSFENLETRYPFHPLAKQAQLEEIWGWYQAGNIEAAEQAAERFIRENPRHENVDYAYYLRGLIFFDQPPDIFERTFRVDLTRRPGFEAEQSFLNFRIFLERFPDSPYAEDARHRMVFLRERLARLELHVARYYMRRQAWVAAANRARGVIETYDGTTPVPHALEVMIHAYGQLGLVDLAGDAQRVLDASFPSFAGDELNRGRIETAPNEGRSTTR